MIFKHFSLPTFVQKNSFSFFMHYAEAMSPEGDGMMDWEYPGGIAVPSQTCLG